MVDIFLCRSQEYVCYDGWERLVDMFSFHYDIDFFKSLTGCMV